MIRKKLFWHLVVSWVTRFRLNCLVQFFYEIQWWGHRITDRLRRLSTVTDQCRFHSEHCWWARMRKRGTEGLSSGRKANQGLGLGGSHHQLLFSLPVTSGSSLDSYLGLRDMKQSCIALSHLSWARLLPEVFLFLHLTSLQLTPAT